MAYTVWESTGPEKELGRKGRSVETTQRGQRHNRRWGEERIIKRNQDSGNQRPVVLLNAIFLYLNNLFYFVQALLNQSVPCQALTKIQQNTNYTGFRKWKWSEATLHLVKRFQLKFQQPAIIRGMLPNLTNEPRTGSSCLPPNTLHLLTLTFHSAGNWYMVVFSTSANQQLTSWMCRWRKCWHLGGKISTPPHTSVPPGFHLPGFHLSSSSPCHQEVAGQGRVSLALYYISLISGLEIYRNI